MGCEVLVVGWAGASWAAVSAEMDAGRMPELRALTERGAQVVLEPVAPMAAAAFFTTVATGAEVEQHGVVLERWPDAWTGRAERAPAWLRQAPALWELEEALVVGWPATHPARAGRGVMVTDRFADVLGWPGHDWPVMPGSVFPEERGEALRELRVATNDFTAEDLRELAPGVEAESAEGRRLAVECARAATAQAVAVEELGRRAWGLAMVHFGAVGLGWLDAMLGVLVRAAGEGARVLVVASPAEGRLPFGVDPPEGVLWLAGPGFVEDAWVGRARVEQVAPTVLAALGRRWAGFAEEPVWAAWQRRPELAQVEDFEWTAEETEDAAAVAGLRAEGYEEVETETAEWRSRRAMALALVQREPERAFALLEEAERLLGTDPYPVLVQAFLLAARGQAEGARARLRRFAAGHELEGYVRWVELLVEAGEGRGVEPAELEELVGRTRLGQGLLLTVLGQVYGQRREWARAAECYERALASGEMEWQPRLALAGLCLETGQWARAEEQGRRLARLGPLRGAPQVVLGRVAERRGEREAARAAYAAALRLEPESAEARAGLERVCGR